MPLTPADIRFKNRYAEPNSAQSTNEVATSSNDKDDQETVQAVVLEDEVQSTSTVPNSFFEPSFEFLGFNSKQNGSAWLGQICL